MNNPYIYQCKKDCCIMTRQQYSREIWTPDLGADMSIEKGTTCSRAHKGIQAIRSGRSVSKGSLANCPQNRLGDFSLPVWMLCHHIERDTEIKPPDSDYTLSSRAENNCRSWLPQQAQRSMKKVLLITAIIIISIVPSSPGHGPVPHCVNQCANREEKNKPCPRNRV